MLLISAIVHQPSLLDRMATMAAAYEHLVDEEELLALRELAATDVEETDSTDRAMAADLMTLLRKVADLDGAGQALCPEELAWLQGLEEDTVRTEKEMASMAEGILRGAAVLDTRPGEDQAAVVAELQRQAVQCRTRRMRGRWPPPRDASGRRRRGGL